MYTEIGSFNAKAKLSELLQKVMRGQRYTITLRGRPVADLVPCAGAAASDLKSTQNAVEAMRHIHKIRGVSTKTIAEWLKEGRK